MATLAGGQRDKSLSPTAAALIRGGLIDYARVLRTAKGDDTAQARDIAAILLATEPAQLSERADSVKSAPRLAARPGRRSGRMTGSVI